MGKLSITRKFVERHGYQVENRFNGFLLGYYNPQTKTITGMLEMEGVKITALTKRAALAEFNEQYEIKQNKIAKSI